jgi:hypothetical protein
VAGWRTPSSRHQYKLRLPRSSRFSKAGDFCCGEVFLQEHFVGAVLYVQLRACPAGVYGRAFLGFRKMCGATKKAAELRSTGKTGTDVTIPRFQELLRPENGECPVCPRFIPSPGLFPGFIPRFIVVPLRKSLPLSGVEGGMRRQLETSHGA